MRLVRKTALRALTSFACLGVVGRLLVPVGFMPAAPDEGWPIKLCPGHYAAAGGPEKGPGPGSGRQEPDEDGGPIHCPLGRVFSSAALVDTFDLAVTFEPTAVLAPAPPRLVSESATPRPQPRGPPAPLPLDTWRAG